MKYVISCFIFVLGFLQFNFLQGVDLQSDLARLDVELTSLSKMIPAGKRSGRGPLPKTPVQKKAEAEKKGFFEDLKKGAGSFFKGAKDWTGFGNKASQEIIKEVSFDDAKRYWPAKTKIKIDNKFKNIDDGIESLKRAGKNNISEGTIIRPAGYFKYEVAIGEKSYNFWHNAKFDEPFVAIEVDDYEEFPEGTKIYIKDKSDPLVVGSHQEIHGIDQYIDEKNSLLGVVKINNQDVTSFVGKYGPQQYSDVIDELTSED